MLKRYTVLPYDTHIANSLLIHNSTPYCDGYVLYAPKIHETFDEAKITCPKYVLHQRTKLERKKERHEAVHKGRALHNQN